MPDAHSQYPSDLSDREWELLELQFSKSLEVAHRL